MGQEQSLHGRRYTTPRHLAMGYCGTSRQAVDMDVSIGVERPVRKAIDPHWVKAATRILLPSPRRPCPTPLHDRSSEATLHRGNLSGEPHSWPTGDPHRSTTDGTRDAADCPW